MARHAIFGKPERDPAEGGAIITTYVVPAYEGNLVVFAIDAGHVRGRWLPWTTMEYGANPYETASAILDEWCDGATSDLRLVDVMSFEMRPSVWELALVFRAELTALPPARDHRTPETVAPGHIDAIGPFDPVDLERWLAAGPGGPAGEPTGSQRLIF